MCIRDSDYATRRVPEGSECHSQERSHAAPQAVTQGAQEDVWSALRGSGWWQRMAAQAGPASTEAAHPREARGEAEAREPPTRAAAGADLAGADGSDTRHARHQAAAGAPGRGGGGAARGAGGHGAAAVTLAPDSGSVAWGAALGRRAETGGGTVHGILRARPRGHGRAAHVDGAAVIQHVPRVHRKCRVRRSHAARRRSIDYRHPHPFCGARPAGRHAACKREHGRGVEGGHRVGLRVGSQAAAIAGSGVQHSPGRAWRGGAGDGIEAHATGGSAAGH
eukprot:6212424-Pleurochrysis_carterae.AAC.2